MSVTDQVRADQPRLKRHVLGYLKANPGKLSLAEAADRQRIFADLPDELYRLADDMTPKPSTFLGTVQTMISLSKESVKLAEAWPGGGPATRIAAAMQPALAAGNEGSEGTGSPTFAASRPDMQLAKLANEIRLSDDVDYGQAMRLACERDPELAKRYAEDRYGGPAAAPSTDRPDIELAERAKARAEKDGVDYSKAMSLELVEDPALAKRYHERRLDGAAPEPSMKVKPPPGMRLVSERPDVQLAERVKARQKNDGVDWGEASRLELAEDPALSSRYADFQAGRTALQEATYRAEQIRTAPRSNLSPDKAFSAALAEDPQLRAGVAAYFEKA